MSAGGLQKTHGALLLAPIFIASLITIALAAASFQELYDPESTLYGNDATVQAMSYAIPAATLAIGTVLSGAYFALGKSEGWVPAAAALSTAWVSWSFGLASFGFACKASDLGGQETKLKALTAFTIILFILETVYVGLLHMVLGSGSTPS